MPGLLTLKTDLKSLKYGHDTPGGGDSGQPYIKTDINSIDATINRVRLTKFDDGLIRGGIIGATNAAVTDTLRIGKFLTDFPKGPLFIVKQVGLQLTNPRVESSTLPANRPTSGQGAVTNVINFISNTANKIENAVGPTRIYNLGINTLAQVPVNAIGGHIVRHGFLPNNDSSKYYENVVTIKNFQNNTNRLLDLANNFNLGPWGANKLGVTKKEQGFLNKLAGIVSTDPLGGAIFGGATAILNTNKELEIDSYLGGANSVYGIGTTTIRRALDGDTENKTKIDFAREQSAMFAGKTRNDKGDPVGITISKDLGVSNFTSSIFVSKSFSDLPTIKNPNSSLPNDIDNIPKQGDKQNPFKYETEVNYANTLGVSKAYFSGSQEILNNTEININNPTNKPPDLDLATYSKLIKPDIIIGNPVTQTRTPVGNSSYAKYKSIIESRKLTEIHYISGSNPVNQFGIYGNESYTPGVVRDYGNNNILPDATTYPIYYNGDKTVNIKLPWNEVTRELRVGSGRQDEINLTPIFGVSSSYDSSENVGNKSVRDLVKFRIQAVDTNKPNEGQVMVFRAYLSNLSDNTDATWNSVKYAGRGEPFYIYDGFSRKISVSFKVAALSEGESKFIYQKLNFLMSNTMPDYQNNLMRGPLIRLTIGNWIDSQLGILSSVQFKVPEDSPWEIAIDEPEGGSKLLILPHIVEVTLNFTPIGSESKGANRLAEKSETTSHLAQNNTGKDAATLQYIQ
jgi:hypothetical protein